MVFAQKHIVWREILSLLLGILAILVSLGIFLIKQGAVQLQGFYLQDAEIILILTILLGLCGIVLLINTLGSITHVWGKT